MSNKVRTWLCGKTLPHLSTAFTGVLSTDADPDTADTHEHFLEELRSVEPFVCSDVLLSEADDETIKRYKTALDKVAESSTLLGIGHALRDDIWDYMRTAYSAL